jgi:hypothetical protein
MGSDPNKLVFDSIDDVERLIHNSHQNLKKILTDFKVQFIRASRLCLDAARKELVDCLAKKLSSAIDSSALRVEMTSDLDNSAVNIDALLMSSIKNRVLERTRERHSAASAFQALERSITNAARRRKRGSSTDAPANEGKELREKEDVERDKALDDLGFFIRAPVAAIAAIPWLLGAGVWPFMKKVCLSLA